MTASALSRDTKAFDRRPGYARSRFVFFPNRILVFCPTKARLLNPAGDAGPTSHLFGLRDHDSLCRLPPNGRGEAERPIKIPMDLRPP